MKSSSPADAKKTVRRPWWLILSFGLALVVFGGTASFLCTMLCAGLQYLIDGFYVRGEDFCVGLILSVGSLLLFLALLTTTSSEIQAVIGKSICAARHQAKLWQQARRVVMGCIAVFLVLHFFITSVPGSSFVPGLFLLGAFFMLHYLSSTHERWSSFLQREPFS